jgi:type IV pilus assembly protein PilW
MRTSGALVLRQRGFSLVELMVSLVIGLILLLGAVAIMVSSKQNYVIQDDLARIQENARFAMDMIASDLKVAGYMGCINDMTPAPGGPINNRLSAAGTGGLLDFVRPLEGFQGSNDPAVAPGIINWLPTNTAVANLGGGANENPVNNSDAITIRHIGGPAEEPTAAMANSQSPITIANTTLGLAVGEIAAISSCSTSDVFQVTGLTGGIQHAASGLNTTDVFNGAYGTTGVNVSRATAVRYYVGSLPAGDPAGTALFRLLNNDPNPQRLVDGVEMMQITYGVDSTGDGLPNCFTPASAACNGVLLDTTANNWNNVVSVRIALLLASPDQVASDVDNNTYQVNDVQVQACGAQPCHPQDRRRRKVVSTTVLVRNDSL